MPTELSSAAALMTKLAAYLKERGRKTTLLRCDKATDFNSRFQCLFIVFSRLLWRFILLIHFQLYHFLFPLSFGFLNLSLLFLLPSSSSDFLSFSSYFKFQYFLLFFYFLFFLTSLSLLWADDKTPGMGPISPLLYSDRMSGMDAGTSCLDPLQLRCRPAWVRRRGGGGGGGDKNCLYL